MFLTQLSLLNFMIAGVLALVTLYKKAAAPLVRFAMVFFIFASTLCQLALVQSLFNPSMSLGLFTIPQLGLWIAAFLSCLALLLASILHKRETALVFCLPIIAVLWIHQSKLSGNFAGFWRLLQEHGANLLYFHIAAALVGQSLALLACVVSLLYISKHALLKSKQWQLLNRGLALPSMEVLGQILRVSLRVGFLCLSISLLSGIIYVFGYTAKPNSILTWPWNLKMLWSWLVWLWYLCLLFVRSEAHASSLLWQAKMSLLGFSLLSFSYFGLLFLQ